MAQLRGNRAEETEKKPREQGQLKCCRAGVRTRKREALERKALEPVRCRVLSRKDGHTLLRKRPPPRPSLEEGYPKCSVEWLPLCSCPFPVALQEEGIIHRAVSRLFKVLPQWQVINPVQRVTLDPSNELQREDPKRSICFQRTNSALECS